MISLVCKTPLYWYLVVGECINSSVFEMHDSLTHIELKITCIYWNILEFKSISMITIKINPDINDMVIKTAIVVVVTTKASCSELGDCDFKPAMLRRYIKYSTVQLKLVGGGGGS